MKCDLNQNVYALKCGCNFKCGKQGTQATKSTCTTMQSPNHAHHHDLYASSRANIYHHKTLQAVPLITLHTSGIYNVHRIWSRMYSTCLHWPIQNSKKDVFVPDMTMYHTRTLGLCDAFNLWFKYFQCVLLAGIQLSK